MKIIFRLFCCVILLASGITGSYAQDTAAQAKAAAYTKTITERADKIVATLGIEEQKKYNIVRDLVRDNYRNLNTVYETRDEALKMLKANTTDKTALEAGKKKIEEKVEKSTGKVHKKFIKSLSRQLDTAQVTKIKDGLTYNVVHVTYTGYQAMIPTLTEPEKAQILSWLLEAREKSMDAESSDKKHAVFGKYKGRINNYLSAQGYDAQKERAAWEERIKAEKANKQ